MLKKLVLMVPSLMLALLVFIGMVAPAAHADETIDAGGVIATVVKDSTTGKLFVNLDLSKTGLGIDSPAWVTHARLSVSSVDSWIVPQKAVNLLEVDAVTGVVEWQIFDERRDDYVLAAGEANLANQQVKQVDLYTQEGYYHLNGRHWFTECEPYSQTERCWTDIWATQTKRVGNAYVSETEWVFNNLTYLASARSLWANNPLGYNTQWTAKDGRKWMTECDTEVTGRNGCRSYVITTVFHVRPGGVIATKSWVFNNMVRFTVPDQE